MSDIQSGSYFIRADECTFVPTEHAGGAWSDEDLHVSPVVGLIVHHLEQWRRDHDLDVKSLNRLSLDILGRLERGDIEMDSRMLRPGRTIELIETTVTVAGRVTLLARVWFMSEGDTSVVADGQWEPLPAPGTANEYLLTDIWRGGYINSIEARSPGVPQPGRAAAWIRSDLDLVEGEQASPVASFVALIDTANGVAVREPGRVDVPQRRSDHPPLPATGGGVGRIRHDCRLWGSGARAHQHCAA